MGTVSQLQDVGSQCPKYSAENMLSSSESKYDISCTNCKNWDGKRCSINMFDKVLTGMDQC